MRPGFAVAPRHRWAGLVLCLALGGGIDAAAAQPAPPSVAVEALAPPDLPGAVLLPAGADAPPQTERWEDFGGQRIVRNVTRPRLIPVLPEPGKGNGQAVVIAPGGNYLMLSVDSEGLTVAERLARQGIAAFVLLYRTEATPAAPDEFGQLLGQRMRALIPQTEGSTRVAWPAAVDDAQAAMRLVRERSAEWGVDPHRLGFLGFSAGALVGRDLLLREAPGTLPDFIGQLYGPVATMRVPAAAPPIFVALAADDPIYRMQGLGIVASWRAAGKSIELHLYSGGGHGFGMRPKGTTSDHWIEPFLSWLRLR